MAQLDKLTVTVFVIFTMTTLTSMVSCRGMMARRDAEIGSSISRNLMDENINFAEQVLEVNDRSLLYLIDSIFLFPRS